MTYEWHFVLTNNITNGFIYLKFPPNFYVLDSTPEPTGSFITEALEKIDKS